MKLAISNIGWGREVDDSMYQLLSEVGIEGLEIAPSRIWDTPEDVTKDEALSLKRKLTKYGLSVVAFQSLFYNKSCSIFSGEGMLHLMKMIDLASYFGKIALVVGSPKNRNCNDMGMAVNFFRSLNSYANNRVTLCIEPNPVEYGTNFINTTREAVKFARKAGIKINLDCGAIILNGENTRVDVKDIGHVHLSEPYLAPLSNFEMFRGVMELDFDGWYSIESKTFTYGSLFI
jgi:sugar phosphate isomerase/epimerase